MIMRKEEWERRRALVEEGLLRELREDEAFDARLAESMKYSLMAGGKRLRPILLMAAADAAGGRRCIMSAGGAEGHKLLSCEAVRFQKGVHHAGLPAPPDGKAHENHVILRHVHDFAGHGRAAVWVRHLQARS